MRRCRPAVILCGLLAVCALPAPAQWDDLFAARLEQSVAYREALLQLRSAELRVSQLEDVFLPYIRLSVAPQGQSLVSADGFSPVSLTPSLELANVLGTDLSLSWAMSVDPDATSDIYSPGGPQLSATRNLFEETDVQLLEASAGLIRANASVRSARDGVRENLAREIFTGWRASRALANAREREALAQAASDGSRDPGAARSLELALLQARRSRMQAEQTIAGIDADVAGNVEALYAQLMGLLDEWVAALPPQTTPPGSSAAIRAQELATAAAERERDRAFLAYVPNPELRASVGFDLTTRSLEWSVWLRVSATVLDRGERALAALQRREGAEIEKLRLDQLRESFAQQLERDREDLEIAKIDLQVATLELEIQRSETQKSRRLHEGGYITARALRQAELALAAAELDQAAAAFDLKMQQLALAAYYAEWSEE